MKKALILSSAILAFSASAQETYTYEVSSVYTNGDGVDLFGLTASHYFSPVDTSKGPLAEAVFLDRSNAVDLSYARAEFEGGFDSNAWGIGGTYQVEDSGLFVNASTVQVNASDSASYNLGLGYYISNDWTVSAETSFDEDVEYAGITFATKKLLTLGNDRFLNLEAAISIPDEGDDSYAVVADYYFNRNISVGLGYDWASSFSDGTTTLDVHWFVTPAVALSIAYAESDVGGFSSDATAFGIVGRF